MSRINKPIENKFLVLLLIGIFVSLIHLEEVIAEKRSIHKKTSMFSKSFIKEIESELLKGSQTKLSWSQRGLTQKLILNHKGKEFIFKPRTKSARLLLNMSKVIRWPGKKKLYFISTWQIGRASQELVVLDLSQILQPVVFRITSSEEVSHDLSPTGVLNVVYFEIQGKKPDGSPKSELLTKTWQPTK